MVVVVGNMSSAGRAANLKAGVDVTKGSVLFTRVEGGLESGKF